MNNSFRTGGRRCSNQNGELLSAAFYLKSSLTYCSRTSCAWWRTRSQQIISNCFFFFFPLRRQRRGKKLLGLLYQLVRGWEGVVWGSPKGFAAARVVAQGSQPCTLGSHPGLSEGTATIPSQGQRNAWWQDTWKQAAESWLQQGHAWGAGTITLVPPEHPCLSCGASEGTQHSEDASPPAIKFFFIPIIFLFWSSIYIHTHFFPGCCCICAGGTFLANACDRNVFSYPLKLKAIKKRMNLMNRPCRITTLKL